MITPVTEYFIGSYLREERDVINQFRIRTVFQMILVALTIMTLVLFIYLISGYVLESVRTFLLIIFFTVTLFYLKASKNVYTVAHVLLWLAWLGYAVNLFFFFQKFDTMMTLLAAINIIFAFHVLGQRWGIFYFFIHFLPAIGLALLNYNKVKFTDFAPHIPHPVENAISAVLVCLALIYLVYQYQQAFIISKIKLEDTLKELQKAKDMAEEMNRLKTNFLSNMSHEIRTPINGILGISQILEMETKDPALLQYIEIQKQSGRRLLTTITSILNLARLESEKEQLKLTVIDINLIVKNCADAHALLALAKNLKFHVDINDNNFLCLSDHTMLYHVISNVIGNAIKFTEKGDVSIITSLSPSMANFICITVSDTGIGISKEFLPKIFNPFEQESTGHNRGYEGTGLGLPISKRYVELLGGEILVNSEKGKGSTFRILLPRYLAKA